MAYKTCVTIAEKSLKKIKENLKIAFKESDYVEIRFDFLKPEEIPIILEVVKNDLKKVVCTLRSKSEGGEFGGNEKERIAILKLIAEYNPFLLDIEFNTIKNNKTLTKFLKSTKTNLLVSWHDFRKTPKFSELQKLMNQMSRFSSNVKIVTTAKSINDATQILKLYHRNKKIRLIAFAMGNSGRISRILCLYLGSPYTYVSLGKPVASGQFSLDEIKKITRLKIG